MLDSIPITLVGSLDALQRDILLATVGFGSHRTVVLRHDIDYTRGLLRRVISDERGILERHEIFLDHACSGCAMREDALPTLERLASDGTWDAIAYAPPLGTDPLVVATGICGGERRGRSVIPGAHLATVAVAATAATLVDDILGDALLADREGETPAFAGDERSIGEALAPMLEFSDLVFLDEEPRPQAQGLLSHLLSPDIRVVVGAHTLTDCDFLDRAHSIRDSLARRDPEKVRAHTSESAGAPWTLDLASEKPFHPARLVELVEELGAGRLRARGTFWVPTRPSSVCQWEGAGGQVSIGDIAEFSATRSEAPAALPETHLVITGDVPSERDRVKRAFERILLTDDEWERGLIDWLGRADGLEPWLGERRAAA